MLIAVAAPKGAPGATSTALALAMAWPRPVLIADLDPRGGDLMWGFGQGRDAEGRGLLSLHVAARHQPLATAIWSQVVALGETCWLLPGIDEPRHAGTMDWAGLARALAGLGDVDVIADCGAVPAVRPPVDVWAAADLVTLVVRPTLPAIHAAQNAAEILRVDLTSAGLGAERLTSIVVGPGRPYPAKDVAAAMAATAPLLGSLPWDEGSAQVLAGLREVPKRFASSSLMRAAAELAREIGGTAMDHQRAGQATRAGRTSFAPPSTGESAGAVPAAASVPQWGQPGGHPAPATGGGPATISASIAPGGTPMYPASGPVSGGSPAADPAAALRAATRPGGDAR